MSTRRLLVLPFMLLLLAACAPATPVTTPVAPSTTAPTSSALLEREFVMLAEGEGVLTLQASGPGSSWGRAGAEAAVVSVHVDGNYRADVVLFRGETTGAYEVMLGPLAAGKHRLAIQLEPGKSAAGAREVKVTSAEVRAFPQADPLYRAIAHAPILYGRDESARSDTPLLAYHEVTTNPAGGRNIQYTLVFSNEDGGTEPDGLMARWGRLVDIEFVYRLTLGPGGEVSNEEYQAKDHKVLAFTGAYEGKHPLIRVATLNNVFADTGSSRFRFALPPLEALGDTAREEVLDAHPWSYEIMAQEWGREAREGTERTAKAGTRAVSDPRELPVCRVQEWSGCRLAVRCKAGSRGQAARRRDVVYV